jgi:hypothetical protein
MSTLRSTPLHTLALLILAAFLTGCARQATTTSSDTANAPSSSEISASRSQESPDAAARQARDLIAKGSKDEARTLLEGAAAKFPESSSLHRVHAELLWDLSGDTDPELLRQAAQEATRAAELDLQANHVDYAITSLVAQTLGRTKDRETLERLFERMLAKDASSPVYLDYATGLVLLGDPKAEEAFKNALRSDPNGDAAARYGEWLLDQRRETDVLAVLPAETPVYYIHFLRGLALERLGQTEAAKAAYGRYRNFSRTFPAPTRFRLPGSTLQSGIHFQDS